MVWSIFGSSSSTDTPSTNAPHDPKTATYRRPVAQPESATNQDQALESFLRDLDEPGTSKPNSIDQNQPTQPSPPPPPESTRPNAPSTRLQTPSHTPSPANSNPGTEKLDISPESLYPRTMSCRQAFDQAFYCQSLGGKFNDIYRYGTLQSCSENWNQFWFCMRNRSFGGESGSTSGSTDTEGGGGDGGPRGRRIAEYYADRERRNKAAWGSSEDIWEMRTVPVERAFHKNLDEVFPRD